MAEQVIKGFMNKNVGIQINPSSAKELFQSHDIRAMRKVRYRISENLARRLDSFYGYKFAREVPPWAGRLKFAVEEYLRRLYAVDGAFQARVMYQAPRFTTAASRKTKTIM